MTDHTRLTAAADAEIADAVAAQVSADAAALSGAQATITNLQQQLAACQASNGGGGGTGPVTPSGWAPLWSDDFTGDLSKWNVRTSALGTDRSYNLPANVALVGGMLVVTGKLESYGGRSYTSGYLDTIGKFALPATNWRLEFRAKMPFQMGSWPAPIWLRADDGSAGEIDPVEAYGAAPLSANITLHTDYSSDHMAHANVPWSQLKNPDRLDWHTYVVEKVPGSIKVMVDEATRTFTPATYPYFAAYYDAGKRWNLRSCLQIGPGTNGGGKAAGVPDATTDWSKMQMVVDYVRAFTKA